MPYKRFRSGGNPGYSRSVNTYRSGRYNKRKVGYQRRFARKVKAAIENFMTEKQIFFTQGHTRLAAAVGSQGAGTVLIQNSQADLVGCYNTIKNGLITANGQANVASGSLYVNKFDVNTYVCNLLMKNNTTFASAIVDIYEMVPRNDAVLSPDNAFTNGIADQTASGTVWATTTYGLTPFMINMLTTQYKILRKQQYILAPGASQSIEIRDKKSYNVDFERVRGFGVTNISSQPVYSAFKNLTRYWFAIVRGEPINDSSTTVNVSTSVCAVDFITTETYYVSFLQPNATTINEPAGGFAAITTQSDVNVQTGTSSGVPVTK